jgi:hypothetical protein
MVDFKEHELTLTDVLISPQCGKGSAKRYYQRRTLIQYAFVSAIGLTTFYKSENARLRTAGLGLLFPGAGFVAACTIPSIIAFIVTMAAVPLIIFLWFGCGGLAFPIALWAGSLLGACFLTRDTVLESAGLIVAIACALGIAYVTYLTSLANTEASKKRSERNSFLVNAVQNNQVSAQPVPPAGSREASLRNLRFLQWMIEMGLADNDDFSYHDIIDQFQTSAIRYQLYQGQWELAVFQTHYAPNFHGYLTASQRGLIEKSLTQRVMNFWKWECLLGKFSFDWDPIKEDNIVSVVVFPKFPSLLAH